MEIEEPTKILQDVHQRDFHTHYKNSAIWKTRNPSCSFCWWKGCTLFQVQPGCSIHIWVFFRWSVFPSTSNSLSSRVAFSWANVCHPLSLVSESQATEVFVICCSLWCTTVVLSDGEENLFHEWPRIWEYSHLNLALTCISILLPCVNFLFVWLANILFFTLLSLGKGEGAEK